MTDNNYKTNTVEEINSLAPGTDAHLLEDASLQEMIELTAFHEDFLNQEKFPITEEFRRKCIETADGAWELARLRAEHERLGSHPISLVEYLRQLASAVNISLTAVAARFGITELSPPTADNIRPLARLSREIGVSLDDTIQFVRIGFTELTGTSQMARPMFRSSGPLSRKTLAECEPDLRRIESNYNAQEWKELERLRAEIHAVFINADGEANAR